MQNISCKQCLFLLAIICLVPCSCKKYISEPEMRDGVTADAVFASDGAATSSVLGIYKRMMLGNNILFNGAPSLYAGLSADELLPSGVNSTAEAFAGNSLDAGNSVLLNMWSKAYFQLYQCNAILEGLAASREITPAVRKRLSGEVRFLRAFCYFYLVNLFGDVPLVTTTDYRENAFLSRTSVADIYPFILADLDAALLLLQGTPVPDNMRVSEYTVHALKARVHLYMGQWAQAEVHASAVINSGKYSLNANLGNVFLATSNETIWQLPPYSSSFNTSEGFTFIPSTATSKPTYVLTDYVYNSFENGDGRKSSWVKTNTISGVPYRFPYKYKVKSGSPATEYNIMLRLAEMYLIRAEARLQQDQYVTAKADLDKIRNRAGLPVSAASGKAALLSAIQQEWQVEYFAEWGHRWLDLKRWGILDAVMAARKPGWHSYAALFPLPENELLINYRLTQNPGY